MVRGIELWEYWRIRVLRSAASLLAAASRWFQLRAQAPGSGPSVKDPNRLRSSYVPWQALVGQFRHKEAIRALLDGGAVGNDLPRQSVLPQGNRILVIAAHQDDETIGAAGTLLLCIQAGFQVQVVYYTDGANAFGSFTPDETAEIRKREATAIWQELTGNKPLFMDYPNRRATIARGAGEQLAKIIKQFKPDSIFVANFLEQPVEHQRMSQLLHMAHGVRPIPTEVEVWGYQITTRFAGNVAVDITSVWKKKYAMNRKWRSQNSTLDFAHLAMGRDIANSYYLKGGSIARSARPHAELFIVLPVKQYLKLTRRFLALTPDGSPQPGSWGTPVSPPDFLIIGMQKSGSYWLTALLDAHPQIRAFPSRPGSKEAGEVHLFDLLARARTDYQSFRKSMVAKAGGFFKGAMPRDEPSSAEDWEQLYVRMRDRFNEFCRLQRLPTSKSIVGEKTTETVHHPELVDKLYPGIRKVCILRDPRDRVVSFFFHQRRKRRLGESDVLDSQFVISYIDRVRRDYEGLLKTSQPLHLLTYEQLQSDTRGTAVNLLRFLGADDDADVVDKMVRSSSFRSLAGRSPGQEDDSSHFRRGVSGAWSEYLDPHLAEMMVEAISDLTGRVEQKFDINLSAYGWTPSSVDAAPSIPHRGE